MLTLNDKTLQRERPGALRKSPLGISGRYAEEISRSRALQAFAVGPKEIFHIEPISVDLTYYVRAVTTPDTGFEPCGQACGCLGESYDQQHHRQKNAHPRVRYYFECDSHWPSPACVEA